MKSIEKKVTNTITIQKSKFICEIIPVQSVEEAKKALDDMKSAYVDATHYCYAYIIGNDKRSSDDGEPSGTAGMPILNVLEKKSLNYLLCVVIRYFGGIKLGAGGLVRAYSNAVTKALEISNIVELIKGRIVSFEFPYSNEKQMEYLLSNYQIIQKEYHEQVRFLVEIPESELDSVCGNTSHLSNTIIKQELFIKK